MSRKNPEELWTIAELTRRVSASLADGFNGVASGRVQDLPDVRAVRYYTTIGLIDRPAEIRGRTAYYGRRHLCQLVAIKRLQSQGLSLAQVQERLLNADDRELERLAGIPAQFETAPGGNLPRSAARRRKLMPADRKNFWMAATAPARSQPKSVESNLHPGMVTLVPLTAGLSVAFEPCRAIDADDLAALQAAARPLQQLLIERRLVQPHLERGNHGQSASDTPSC
jgi:DNA-binding transcriptional MerR regulator